MSNDRPESDAELERQVRAERKFSLADAIGRMAGPGAMKGASPVIRQAQAGAVIDDYLRRHLADAGGVLVGTYYNEAAGTSRPLKGTLDPKSQRVAVGPADGENADVVLETGLYNLTQDEAPGLVHFGTAESSPILLVRLREPQ